MLIRDENLQPYLEAVKTARILLRNAALDLEGDEESRAALLNAKTAYLQAAEQLWLASEVEYDGW